MCACVCKLYPRKSTEKTNNKNNLQVVETTLDDAAHAAIGAAVRILTIRGNSFTCNRRATIATEALAAVQGRMALRTALPSILIC